ncbi:MAG: hypothetical protein MUP90_12770, partial [Gammaproteobacteria bacterium]|nr:hypothetical protein [Gammaproteobacteria bacterium]
MSKKPNQSKRKSAPKPTNSSKRKPAPKTTFPMRGWILLAVIVVVAVGVAIVQGNKPAATTGLAAEVSVEQA